MRLCLLIVCLLANNILFSQRNLPERSRNQKRTERQVQKQTKNSGKGTTDERWDLYAIPGKNKGIPEVSAWHAGTAGIIASDAAEISLFNPTRIGFSKRTELLFRIAEEPFLPNIGLKHHWSGKNKLFLASEHTLYFTYPLLKILQNTGFKGLIPDSVRVNAGIAMRHELILSWLMNPRVFGCPQQGSERILSLRAGTEFYAGFGDTEVQPFDYCHSLYHSQLLDNKWLYYGGLQYDSYFSNRFHYSLNGLFYSVDFSKQYAVEANLRLTCYVSTRFGISASCKGAYVHIGEEPKFACLPLLDLTYLINPGRSAIRHGLYKNKRSRR